MSGPDQIIVSVETLTGGTADRFVVSAGPGLPVQQLDGPTAKAALGVTDGADGSPGADGSDGSDGLSAYEVAVAEGFVGDVTAWLASLVGATGSQGIQGIQGEQGPQGDAGATGTAGADGADGADGALAPVYVQVALSGNGQAITSGTKKGVAPVPVAGTITAFRIDCDPANEPSASAVQVDLNKIDRSTGTATSVLSSVASIATGANVSTGGAISGTQTVTTSDMLTFDIDQGSDGKELVATVEITP